VVSREEQRRHDETFYCRKSDWRIASGLNVLQPKEFTITIQIVIIELNKQAYKLKTLLGMEVEYIFV
jgi:hypothetical protein